MIRELFWQVLSEKIKCQRKKCNSIVQYYGFISELFIHSYLCVVYASYSWRSTIWKQTILIPLIQSLLFARANNFCQAVLGHCEDKPRSDCRAEFLFFIVSMYQTGTLLLPLTLNMPVARLRLRVFNLMIQDLKEVKFPCAFFSDG